MKTTGLLRASLTVVIVIVALMLSFGLLPSAIANEKCLRIAFPEIIGNEDILKGAELYRQDMAASGQCIKPVLIPLNRSIVELDHGSLDGIFGWTEDLTALVTVPLLRSNKPVLEVPVFLVARDPSVLSIKDLKQQVLGIWLGFDWAKQVSQGHENTVEVSGGPVMMQKMLFAGRIDAMLVDGYTYSEMLDLTAFTATVLKENKIYSWLKEEHRSHLTTFNAGIDLYRQRFGEWASN
ncbi:hypothetical protein ACQ0MK_12365 [Thalassospira lucentensis]|uniref:hypothetical protein n=1 Tax=Thalassospira lucentensis TaxID=168935 RepID=UPI003D2F0F7B